MKTKNKKWGMLCSSFVAAVMAVQLAAMADTTLVSGFNSSEWTSGVLPWGSHQDHGSEYYQSWNSEFSGGYLTLHSIYNSGGHPYESGVSYCNTTVPNSGYSYVTVDVDMNVPVTATKGCWPAFWLDSAWNWPPEIDIAEFKGDGTVWQNAIGTDNNWKVVRTGIDTQWHHYGLALGPANGDNRTYQLFLDGSIKNQGTFPDNQGVPFWIICNYAMEGDSGSPGPTYNTYVQYHNLNITTHGSAPWYYIQNRTSGLVIDNTGSTSAGALMGQWTKVNSSNLKWQLTPSDSGYYYIKNQTSGLYLDGGGATASGSPVKQWSYVSSYNLQWQPVASDSGNYYIKNRATGMYLDGGGATANGSALKQWGYVSSYNLQWSFQ